MNSSLLFNDFVKYPLILIVLYAIHQYAQGGVCQIYKNLSGQNIIVTGSNTGIGYETAQKLAEMKATVILACRDRKRGEEAVAKIKQETGNQNVFYIPLDLSDLKSIQSFVDNYKKEYKTLYALINNAGVMFTLSKETTQNGFQLQIGTNHIGHFHLTNLLLDYIKKTPKSRVVCVSSMAHNSGEIEWDNYNSQQIFNSWQSYGMSQVSNIYHAMVLNEQFREEKVEAKAVSLHPGAVRTELQRHFLSNFFLRIFYYVVAPFWYLLSKDSLQGAQTSLECALVDFESLQGGQYYSDCVVKQRKAFAKDMSKAKKLWELTEQMISDAKLNLK